MDTEVLLGGLLRISCNLGATQLGTLEASVHHDVCCCIA